MKKDSNSISKYVPEIMEFNEYGRGTVYSISNTGVSEGEILFPEEENFAMPPVHIVEAEGCLLKEELRQLLMFCPEDADDPRIIEHYDDAVFGDLDDWRLYAVAIGTRSGDLEFAIANEVNHEEYQVAFLLPKFPMKIMFEVENSIGYRTQCLYEVDVTGYASAANRPKLLKVTEAVNSDRPREIYFRIGGWFEPEHIGAKNNHYWLVRECCSN